MLFPSHALGILVRILILLVVGSWAHYRSNAWPRLPEKKKNTPTPAKQYDVHDREQLSHRMISFFIVRDAGHILLRQSDRLKDTKWGCKAAGPRTKAEFHVSAFSHPRVRTAHLSSRMQLYIQRQLGALCHESKGIPLPLSLPGSESSVPPLNVYSISSHV